MLRRGDAILARVEKRPTQKNAVDLVFRLRISTEAPALAST